ncbi:MAG: hypothetical protein OEM77_07845 [Nitrosopumilus sp.]|nr:hypothetical protein [Nitrosopumilus sp.]MDH3736849.1 hypothetical protein [Nitrosopumilus sp.]MDH3823094.1 hypothetical protein [Nitrosopumilus sp.]MDH3833027.1 hypothetical protein [Nitrosopumilus sp.]
MNRNSRNISSRVDSETYNSLVMDAESRGISINALINRIIKRHLMWDRFVEEMELVPLTKRSLKKIFRAMDDATIKKIAREVGGTVPQELIYLSYDKFDFVNLMKAIEISDSRFGKVECMVNDSTYRVSLIHNVCENFSDFLTETHQALADSLSLKFRVEHVDNNMICIEFEKPSDS